MRKNWKKMVALTLCLSMATGCQNSKETKVDNIFDKKTEVETEIAEKKTDAKKSGNQTVLDIKANYASSEPYEYAEPVYNVPKDYVFEYTDVPEGFWDAGVVETFAVFTDPDFKGIGKVSINIDDDYSDRTIKISPTLVFDLVNGESECAQNGTWGAKSKFYLVQYVSLEDGSQLDKPIVTVFTIKNEMQTPTLTQSVGTDGVYSLSWTAVDGADSYDVYYYDCNCFSFCRYNFKHNYKRSKCNRNAQSVGLFKRGTYPPLFVYADGSYGYSGFNRQHTRLHCISKYICRRVLFQLFACNI